MSFNVRNLPEAKNEYVAWLDVMGIQSAMSRSMSISANFVFKHHIAALSADRENVKVYPVMDGLYATSESKESIVNFIRAVMCENAKTFLETTEPMHRFLVRGGLAFGPVIHGCDVKPSVDERLDGHDAYKSSVLLGMPMVQANQVESGAPPFGVAIHESARAFSSSGSKPFTHIWLKWVNSDTSIQSTWESLHSQVIAHLDWCLQRHHRLMYPSDRIAAHKALVDEYFASDYS